MFRSYCTIPRCDCCRWRALSFVDSDPNPARREAWPRISQELHLHAPKERDFQHPRQSLELTLQVRSLWHLIALIYLSICPFRHLCSTVPHGAFLLQGYFSLASTHNFVSDRQTALKTYRHNSGLPRKQFMNLWLVDLDFASHCQASHCTHWGDLS